MDRIDILHEIVSKSGIDVFYGRESKIRKALENSPLTFGDIENITEICTSDKKLVKKILTEPDISKTRDEQKELVVRIDGKSIAALKDIHTAFYDYEQKSVEKTDGEFNDGRFIYTVVPARKQCLNLIGSVTPAAYNLALPDTVTVGGKEHKIVSLADGCFESNADIVSVKLPANLETIGKNAFCNCSKLSEIELPRHVKSIGDNAFAYTAVESLVFGDYLEEIGQMAFYKCRNLRTVTVTKRTSQIGVGAFSGCQSLENMEIDDKNGRFVFENGVLYSKKRDRMICVSGSVEGKLSPPRSLLAIEQYAAEDCAGITETELPVSVTSIGACAFRGCTGLKKFKFPNTLEKIGDRAFENCSSLASVNVPVSVRFIGKGAFSDCVSLKTGNIDGTVKYRGMKIFDGCKGLNRITIRKNSEFTDTDFPNNTRVKFVHE